MKLITLNPLSVALVLLHSGILTSEVQRTGFTAVRQRKTHHLRPSFSHPLNLLCFRTHRKPGSSYPSCRGLADQRPWSNTSSAARASNSTCQKKPASSRSCSPVGDPLVWEVVPLQTLYLRSELTQPPASLKLHLLLSPRPANFISKWCDWHVTYAAYDLAFPSPYAEPNWLTVGRAHHFWVTAVVIFIRNPPPCQDEEHKQVWAGLDSFISQIL